MSQKFAVINKHKQPNVLNVQLGNWNRTAQIVRNYWIIIPKQTAKLLDYYSKTDWTGLQKQFYTDKHDKAKQDIKSKSEVLKYLNRTVKKLQLDKHSQLVPWYSSPMRNSIRLFVPSCIVRELSRNVPSTEILPASAEAV